MSWRAQSLQAQLVLRLALVLSVAALLGVGALLYEGIQAANTLGDEELERRAVQIAHYVVQRHSGDMQLELPDKLYQLYHSSSATRLLAVRDRTGALIAASSPQFAQQVQHWPLADTTRPFRLDEFGPTSQDYNGLTVRVESAAGPLWVTVAAVSDAEALARGLMRNFVRDIAWAIPLFAAAILAVAVWSIRRGLRPVHTASERAAAIGPVATGVRLPSDDLPSELLPLVAAVNRALDRLEQGFAVQRQFTANAAHELRTPLAILTAGLDTLGDGEEASKLRADAARMNRLVEQLLRVARLDSAPMDVATRLDLRVPTAHVLEYLTPWAVAQGRALGLEAPAAPVWVRGNADAIGDAVRNLVENAVYHTPIGSEVAVAIHTNGSVTVVDQGPGVPPPDRPYIFERFWRGRGARTRGAGLGLSIVAEIARAHRGQIEVSSVPAGGAKFVLSLPLD